MIFTLKPLVLQLPKTSNLSEIIFYQLLTLLSVENLFLEELRQPLSPSILMVVTMAITQHLMPCLVPTTP